MKTATITGLALLGSRRRSAAEPRAPTPIDRRPTTLHDGHVGDDDRRRAAHQLRSTTSSSQRQRSGSTCTAPVQGATTVLLIAGWGAGGDEAGPPSTPRWPSTPGSAPTTGPAPAPATHRQPTRPSKPKSPTSASCSTAGEPGPYVVVGHSFGGAEAVTFAAEYHDEMIGLVLVDASPTTWPAAVCAVPDDAAALQGIPRPAAGSRAPGRDRRVRHVAGISSLGDLPLTVMTAEHRTSPGLAPGGAHATQQGVGRRRGRLGGLSSRSTVVSSRTPAITLRLTSPSSSSRSF